MTKKVDYSSACSLDYPKIEVEENCIGLPRVVQKVVDGKVVSSVEFVVDDGKENENYRVDDFALENLLAAGVELKPIAFNSVSLKTADEVASGLEDVRKLQEIKVESD